MSGGSHLLRRARTPDRRSGRRPTKPAPGPELEALSARWVGEGIISEEQRAHILDTAAVQLPSTTGEEGAGPREPPGPGLAVEALGYVGGVVVVVAALMLGFQVWEDLGTTVRLLLVGGPALALIAAGAAIVPRAGEVGVRLRSVLWLVATAATAGFFVVLGSQVLDLEDEDALAFTASGVLLVAAALWSLHRTFVQQAAMMVAAMVATAAVISDAATSESLPGLGVWCVGVVWAVLAWGGVLDHRRAGLALGAAGAILGALTTIPGSAGTVLALVTVFGVVGLAVWFRDLALLAVGALGTLNVLPAAVSTWWPETLAAPLALLVVGVVLVLVALYVARRPGQPATTGRDWSHGTPRTACLLAAPVLALLVGVLVVPAFA